MNNVDKEYFRLLDTVLQKGRVKKNRTGIDTIGIFGEQAKFDLQEGFPLLTTKKVFFKGIVHELLWFISGSTNIKYLVDNNVHIWDEWAYKRYVEWFHKTDFLEKREATNPEPMTQEEFIATIKTDPVFQINGEPTNQTFAERFGNLGEGTYGGMWRKFPYHRNEQYENLGVNAVGEGYEFGGVDQLKKVINKLKTNPDDRRMIVSAWHPYWVDHCALPPCHCLFQFHTEELEEYERLQLWQKKHCTFKLADGSSAVTAGLPSWYMGADTSRIFKEHFDKDGIPSRRLNCQLYQRSCDLGLGVCFNWASYSLLLMMTAQSVNMIAGDFVWTGGDVHIYTNHLSALQEQRKRQPYHLPKVELNSNVKDLFQFKYTDIKLVEYDCHPPIKMEVAV